MSLLEKFLYLKKSKIPGAGIGLFTKVDISKGQLILEYKGRLDRWADVKYEDGYNAYLFKLNSKLAINALTYKKSMGRYANDARGLQKITGIRNNSEYIVKKEKCYIASIRKIYEGEEILVPYGKAYWDLVKKIYSI